MKLSDQIKILEFVERGDERGNLVVIEGEYQDIPLTLNGYFTYMAPMLLLCAGSMRTAIPNSS